jgi:hypothetical protein
MACHVFPLVNQWTQGISLTLEQYQAFLKIVPEVNAELRAKGHAIDEAGPAAQTSTPKVKVTPKKSKKAKKANIEETSEEDSDSD